MVKKNIKETLQMQPLTEEEKSSRHILGRLYGPISTYKESTRNGRHYNKTLWENAMNDEIFQEKIANKCLFLELGHPEDRTETDMTKVCACIPEMPKMVDGDLYGYVDILDTPNGRLLKTLCDYGFVPGISSRGTGDVLDDDEVDPETFYLATYDIVDVPAMKNARLSMAESLDTNKLNLRNALTESYNKASDEDKKVMKEALDNLKIKLDDSIQEDVNIDNASSKVDEKEEAINNGSNELVKSLQEALKDKATLEAKVLKLQEQLAVSDTKVDKLNEELSRFKSTTIRLSTKVNESKDLSKEIETLKKNLELKERILSNQKTRINSLSERLSKESSNSQTLNESISSKGKEVEKLNESLTKQKEEYESKINQLNESLESYKRETTTKMDKLLNESKALKESRDGYKTLAYSTINSYIETKATMLGVDANEIKNKLPENYTPKTIDKICEQIQQHNINISRLPFSMVNGRKAKVQVVESVNDKLKDAAKDDCDGEINDDLLKLAGL